MLPGPYTSGQRPHVPPRADPSPGALASGSAPQDSFSPHQAERRKTSVLQRFLEKPAIADVPCLSRGATSLLQRSSGEGASGEEAAGHQLLQGRFCFPRTVFTSGDWLPEVAQGSMRSYSVDSKRVDSKLMEAKPFSLFHFTKRPSFSQIQGEERLA